MSKNLSDLLISTKTVKSRKLNFGCNMTTNKGVMYANLGILDHDRDLKNEKLEKKAIFVSKNLLSCLKPKTD